MSKLFRILLIMALFAAVIALGWLRRPDITPYLLQQLEEEGSTPPDNAPVFETGTLEHTQPENTEIPEKRPNFWPEPLQGAEAAKQAADSGLPDCNVTNYEYNADKSLKGNISNLKDATVNCKIQVNKKTP